MTRRVQQGSSHKMRGLGSHAFTLLELLIVIIIVGVLAGLAVPKLTPTKEKLYDKEAISYLKLIAAADKRYYFAHNNTFYPSSGSANCLTVINGNLSLDLHSRNWNYTLSGGSSMTATAQRNPGTGARTFTLTSTSASAEPVCTGSCF